MMERDSSLLDAFAKQKGMACIDDVDAEPERLSLQSHHELVVAVEFCVAPRPSKLGSLRGSSEKYVSMFDALQEPLDELRGEGMVTLRKASPTEVMAATLAAVRGVVQAATPTRPASANARLRSGGPVDDVAPRIGSFEVLFTLINCQSGAKYGPIQVHSKLHTRRWPLFDKLRQRLDAHLQQFLAKDTGHYEFHQAKERASVAISAQQHQQREAASPLKERPLEEEGEEGEEAAPRMNGEALALKPATARDERPQSAPIRKAPAPAEAPPPAPDENAPPATPDENAAPLAPPPAPDENAPPATPDENAAPLAQPDATCLEQPEQPAPPG